MNFKRLKTRAAKTLEDLLLPVRGEQGRRPLELIWGRQKLRFAAPLDFAFALSARTSVPLSRWQKFLQSSVLELQAEQQNIDSLEQRIGAVIAAYDNHAQPCAPAVGQIGSAVFSKDHDWRIIVAHLLELPLAYDRFVRVALYKYLLYLQARHSTVRLALATKATATTPDDHSKATVLLALSPVADPFERENLHRLPQGQAVTLHLAHGSAIALKLAKHPFSLTHDQAWALVAADGKSYTLHAGLNRVGRSRDNDIALDPDFRNVSRRHLLVQPLSGDVIVLTDLSAHGTYVPPTALAS
jgi:FHA domain